MNRVYHTALAIVPPNSNIDCWSKLQEIRYKLHDKGYYRWPPHINLIYPFVDVCDFSSVLPRIAEELKDFTPFEVNLNEFGTFGGRDKGVCYLSPEPSDVLVSIHSSIQRALEESSSKKFQPHLTVTHCENGREATSIASVESETWQGTSFLVDAVYVLKRDGPDGQYYAVARIPLGGNIVEEETIMFSGMPTEQEDWVKDQRKAQGRNRNKNK